MAFITLACRYARQLEQSQKESAALRQQRETLKQGVLQSQEAGAIDHYTPIVAAQASELEQLKSSRLPASG